MLLHFFNVFELIWIYYITSIINFIIKYLNGNIKKPGYKIKLIIKKITGVGPQLIWSLISGDIWLRENIMLRFCIRDRASEQYKTNIY